MSNRFEAEGIMLICGDCREQDIPKEASIISDPPYGMNWDTDTTRFSGGAQVEKRGKEWGVLVEGDAKPFDPVPWLVFEKVVLFGANHFGGRLPVGTTLVWIKRYDNAYGTFLSDAEVAWMKGGHGVYCFRDIPINGFRKLHPTQKTIPTMAWCMEKAKVPIGSLVCDPYTGSGTTGVACIRTGRRFLGFEIDPTHFQTAVDRIKRELEQPRFEFTPKVHEPDRMLL